MTSIGIAGGGIIGCATALNLMDRGFDVTLFERDPLGLPASVGNAGILAIPEIDPLARPGMLRAAPFWLMDPLGPLTVRWQDLAALTPWFAAFVRAAAPARVAASREALLTLMRDALPAHERLATLAGMAEHIIPTGALTLFDSRKRLDAAFAHEQMNARLIGFDVERLEATAVRALVPALEGEFAGAVLSKGYRTFPDPLGLLRHLQAEVRARGRLMEAEVTAVQSAADGVGFYLNTGDRAVFDRGVIAAGIWSRDLVRKLGLPVLLETERGYNTTFNEAPVTLEMPVFFAEHGFVATPMRRALRIGGAVELARPDAPANFARASAMRRKMRRYVPSLPETGGAEWMGRRPSTPDSVPVIGLNPKDSRIALAFGHGHLGLTLSAVTGEIVADLLSGKSRHGLAPFAIERFAR